MEIIRKISPTEAEIKLGDRVFILKDLKTGKLKRLAYFLTNFQNELLSIFAQCMGTDEDLRDTTKVKLLNEKWGSFINTVPTAKLAECMNIILSTKENPSPISEEFIDEYVGITDYLSFFHLVSEQNRLLELYGGGLNFLLGLETGKMAINQNQKR